MRTVFTVGLLASLIGLLCAEDASACWRRHRHRCCNPCEQYPVCAPCGEQGHVVYASMCQCAGINPCQITCPGPCYSMKDPSGYCHCGCAGGGYGAREQVGQHRFGGGPLIPHYTIGQADRIDLWINGLTLGELDQLLGLSADHHASITTPADKIHYSARSATIADIMNDLNIPVKHKPPKP